VNDADRTRVDRLGRSLDALYPDPRCALDFEDPWQLLVATVLSAQARDERVNAVTPALFARFPDAGSAAVAQPEALVPFIRTLGLFNHKARNVVALARLLVEKHGGEVPRSLDALVELPGVARKTAHVVLQNVWGLAEGFVVDTHVTRLSVRLGLVPAALAGRTDKIERALCAVFPQAEWSRRSHQLILHGRAVCDARRPQCGVCTLAADCPSAAL
jgi:endonuclease-3